MAKSITSSHGVKYILTCDFCHKRCTIEWRGQMIAHGYYVRIETDGRSYHTCDRRDCLAKALTGAEHYTIRPINIDWRVRPAPWNRLIGES